MGAKILQLPFWNTNPLRNEPMLSTVTEVMIMTQLQTPPDMPSTPRKIPWWVVKTPVGRSVEPRSWKISYQLLTQWLRMFLVGRATLSILCRAHPIRSPRHRHGSGGCHPMPAPPLVLNTPAECTVGVLHRDSSDATFPLRDILSDSFLLFQNTRQ